jgi:hypothetical protein
MVDRSSMRYAAVACVVAGGLMMGGTGGVAFAKPDRPGNDGPGTPSEPDSPAPGHGGNHPPMYKTHFAGPISAPKINLPPRLGPVNLPDLNNLSQWRPISQPNLGLPQWRPINLPDANPAPQLPTPTLPSEQPGLQLGPPLQQIVAPPAPPRSITLPPLIPGVQTGPPLVIKNPLPDTLPIDLHLPLVPQLLPPAIVPILDSVTQQIPLTQLVITPLLDDVVLPRLLSDVIIPALLSDVVVPTIPLGGLFPGAPVPGLPKLTDRVAASLTPGNLPADLAPAGMDLPAAPLNSPAPLPSAPGGDPPREPSQPAPAPKREVAQLSEPVAFRAGYSDYLRNAGMAQITSIALPGVIGIVLVTIGGGFIGYRQARAGHIIRAQGIARFLR